jgi:SAM-dependent methyltransferase
MVDRGSPSTPGWRLDEVANAGRENLDVDHVRRYDAKEDADAAAEVELLVGLGLDADARLVDLGAGTGQLAVAAAPACARVTAVDVSPVMVARLEAKLDELGIDNVEVVTAGFLSYEHHGPPADIVYSRFALHHLPDAWKAVALERIRRILRPGGILRLWDVVYDFPPGEAEDRLEAWCAAGVKGDWSRAELEEHIRDEHSTFRWLLEPMLERCGFGIEDVEYSSDGFFGRYVARTAV